MNRRISIAAAACAGLVCICATVRGASSSAQGQGGHDARQDVLPNYALADRFSAKKLSNMVFSTSVNPHWFKNSDKFWYEWQTSEGKAYYVVDPAKATKKEIFDMDRLAMQLTSIIGDPFDAKHIPFKNLKLEDDRYFCFEIESSLMVEAKDSKKAKEGKGGREGASPKKEKKVFRFRYDYEKAVLEDVSDEEKEKSYPRWASVSPDGQKVVYAKNNNLWWMDISELDKLREDPKDSTVVEHRITSDGIRYFGYGTGSYAVSDVEDTTARYSAYLRWSPDSRRFAVVKTDNRDIKELWVINSLAQPRPKLETYKYQMPGEPGPKEYLYLFDMSDMSSRLIKTDAFKDQSLDILSAPYKNADQYEKVRKSVWLGDNERFFISRTSRDIKRVDLCTVDVAADSAVTVIGERMNTYVETLDPEFVGDAGSSDIVFWSERNGWANLYLFSADGTLKRNINDAPYHVSDILHVDKSSVLFTATGVDRQENPYYAHIYRINIGGGQPVRIDESGYHCSSVRVSDDGKYIVGNYSRVDCVPKAALYSASGSKIMDLEEADFSLLFAAGYKFPEQFKVKAADGVTDLWGVMYKPFDFDSTKTYPIIDYVYPGPQVEGNNIAWSKGFTRVDRLAQIGFIVITVGNRGGHPDRSKWYHNYGYGNLRDYGLEDQKYAIQQLASRYDFIDIDRVGIHGHSGGGFMSTAAILQYPDFFKVAVSCAGNHDNTIYNRWWSEQHHGILEEISEKGDTTFKYSIKTNEEIASNLKGHLLLVHGDIDNNVHPANTIRVVDALIRANKRFDMLILPGQRHGFGDMNEYFFWRMADYYSEWLLGSSRRGEVDIRELNND